jgi:hypothetical protein
MRAYVTIVDGDDALLPFFIRHYRRLGATEFPLLVYGTVNHLARVLNTFTLIGERPSEVLGLYPSQLFSARHREATIRMLHPPGQWAFFCDLDEFAEISDVRTLIANGAPYVAGRWFDRVGDGGKLLDVREHIRLERQFPCGGELRAHWGMGDLVYVLSPFAPLLHHPQVCRLGKPAWHSGKVPVVRVHHFKWQRNVVPRLRRRLERIAAVGKSNTPWAARVKKMLAHLEAHQGIDPSLLRHAGELLGI